MNRASHEFFACTAFTKDQHGILMLADLLDQLIHALHLGGDADQLAVTRSSSKLFAENAILLIELLLPDQPLDLAAQFVDMERLRHIVRGTQTRGFDRRLYCAVLGEN